MPTSRPSTDGVDPARAAANVSPRVIALALRKLGLAVARLEAVDAAAVPARVALASLMKGAAQ
ncbi:MAG: hypothetical protein JNK82_32585 [Myxococcaceae bacterium]|nr:hypothetical protein [Myxococcaceae bacterium]